MTFVFITSLRHPDNSVEYERVEAFLHQTLTSIRCQTADEYQVVVVGNRRPLSPLPDRVTFVRVDFAPPGPPAGSRTTRDQLIRDKGSKLAVGLLAARDFSPSHVMLLDADDFVHRDLVKFVLGGPAEVGWVISKGLMYSRRRGIVRLQNDFDRKCGSSLVAPFAAYGVPALLTTHATQAEVVAAFGATLPKVLGSHRDAAEWLASGGTTLRTLPFRGAVYHVDTGENHSGNTLDGVGFVLTRRRAAKYGISSSAPSLFSAAGGVSPRSMVTTLERRGRSAVRAVVHRLFLTDRSTGGIGTPFTAGRVLRVVAVASRTGRYGGPFDTATRQATALTSAGLPTRLLAGFYCGDRPDGRTLAPGRYVRVRALRRGGFLTTFSFRIALAALQEVRRARVVHISFAREPLPAWVCFVATASRRRVVLQPHGMLTSSSSVAHKLVDAAVIRPLLLRASAVIALTEREAEELRRWCGPRAMPPVHVLGNPLPPTAQVPERPRTLPSANLLTVVFIARLHPRKRVSIFLEAAAAAAAAQLPWRWVVFGPDEGDGDLVRAAARDVETVEYRGSVPAEEVVREVDAAAVFVLPAANEPWGNVLVTALALGVPVIATRSAALAEKIEQYGAGGVVPDRDPTALLAAVKAVLSHDAYAQASAGALQLRAELLDPDMLRAGLARAVTGNP